MVAGGDRNDSGKRRSSSQPARRRGRRPKGAELVQECFLCARAASCPPTELVTEYMRAYRTNTADAKREIVLSTVPLEANEGHLLGKSKVEENAQVPSLFDYWDEVREWATEHRINFIYVPGRRPEIKRRNAQIKLEGAFTFLTDYGENYVLFKDAFRPALVKPRSLLHLQGHHSFLPEYREKYTGFVPEKRSMLGKQSLLKLEGETMFVSERSDPFPRLAGLPLPPIENTFRHHRNMAGDVPINISEYNDEFEANKLRSTAYRYKDKSNSTFLPAIESKFIPDSNHASKLLRERTDLHPATTSASRRARSGHLRRHDKVLPILTRSGTTRSLDRPRRRSRRPETAKKPIFRMKVDKTVIEPAADEESSTRIKWKMNAEKASEPSSPLRPGAKSFLVLEHSLLGSRGNKWMRD